MAAAAGPNGVAVAGAAVAIGGAAGAAVCLTSSSYPARSAGVRSRTLTMGGDGLDCLNCPITHSCLAMARNSILDSGCKADTCISKYTHRSYTDNMDAEKTVRNTYSAVFP